MEWHRARESAFSNRTQQEDKYWSFFIIRRKNINKQQDCCNLQKFFTIIWQQVLSTFVEGKTNRCISRSTSEAVAEQTKESRRKKVQSRAGNWEGIDLFAGRVSCTLQTKLGISIVGSCTAEGRMRRWDDRPTFNERISFRFVLHFALEGVGIGAPDGRSADMETVPLLMPRIRSMGLFTRTSHAGGLFSPFAFPLFRN